MAVAMASCGSTLGVYTKLVVFEKQPISKNAFFGCNSGSDPVKHLSSSLKPRYINLFRVCILNQFRIAIKLWVFLIIGNSLWGFFFFFCCN